MRLLDLGWPRSRQKPLATILLITHPAFSPPKFEDPGAPKTWQNHNANSVFTCLSLGYAFLRCPPAIGALHGGLRLSPGEKTFPVNCLWYSVCVCFQGLNSAGLLSRAHRLLEARTPIFVVWLHATAKYASHPCFCKADFWAHLTIKLGVGGYQACCANFADNSRSSLLHHEKSACSAYLKIFITDNSFITESYQNKKRIVMSGTESKSGANMNRVGTCSLYSPWFMKNACFFFFFGASRF